MTYNLDLGPGALRQARLKYPGRGGLKTLSYGAWLEFVQACAASAVSAAIYIHILFGERERERERDIYI